MHQYPTARTLRVDHGPRVERRACVRRIACRSSVSDHRCPHNHRMSFPRRYDHSVLFIGNSFLFDVPWYYGELLESSQAFDESRVHVQQHTKGSWTLGVHWNLVNEDPESILGRYLGREWEMHEWDFVILQEQSQIPSLHASADEQERRTFASSANSAMLLGKLISRRGGAVRLLQTWGDQEGDGNFAALQASIDRGFAHYVDILAGDGVMAEMIPVGDAWRLVQNARVGLFSRLYQEDGAHPSPHGTYLAACVAFASLVGSPVGLKWAPEDISNEERLLLQHYADATRMPPSLVAPPTPLLPRVPPLRPPPSPRPSPSPHPPPLPSGPPSRLWRSQPSFSPLASAIIAGSMQGWTEPPPAPPPPTPPLQPSPSPPPFPLPPSPLP
eukprot:2452634-Prymnesium_polylepis.1